ncbi:hypothetical protein MBLNU457_6814t1 [Dothideomycetes sp. NU457]
MDSLQTRPIDTNTRSKSSGVLQSITKSRNRFSRDVTQEQPLSARSGNAQSVPLLPADHPHFKPSGSENVAPPQDERRSRRDQKDDDKPSQKRSKSAISLRTLVGSDDRKSKDRTDKDKSEKKARKPKKPVKTKSSTGLSAMFAKMNKSNKDLSQPVEGKTNPSPPSSANGRVEQPIWAQSAARDDPAEPMKNPRVRADITNEQLRDVKSQIDLYTPKDYSPFNQQDFHEPALGRPTSLGRPRSAIMSGPGMFSDMLGRRSTDRSQLGSRGSDSSRTSSKAADDLNSRRIPERAKTDDCLTGRKVSNSSTEQPAARGLTIAKRGTRVMAAVAALTGKTEDELATGTPTSLEPKAVNEAFEAVLEKRNIPEDQRQKMRSLTLHVKAEFVRQDKGASRPNSPQKSQTWSQPSETGTDEPIVDSPVDEADLEPKGASKRSRPRSKTFTFSKGDSPTKKQKAGARPTSIHGVEEVLSSEKTPVSEKRSSWSRGGSKPAVPGDFVEYLRKEQDPVKAEVGRLHKLRILLRNETVDWVNEFIELGGMAEIVDLLHRIMAIEWREDHEDQLLHETLLCLKGLCTTNAALEKLSVIAPTLFPKLLGMIFDEEKKGPAEFNTRGIITTILFAYLSGASRSKPAELEARAREILSYLTDPQKPEQENQLDFVLSMRERRPYRVWAKEVTNVSREVFWIFLHHLNVVTLPSRTDSTTTDNETETSSLSASYTSRHFPTTRAPVPAAPYIGGVEWDATTYITSHLDLLNGLIASLPTATNRNALRADLLASGWEKTMGGTLRTCKEKFYMPVHDALRVWVAAASEDGWDVRVVREGFSKEERERASPRKAPSPRKKVEEEVVPKLDMPKLSLGMGGGDEFVF